MSKTIDNFLQYIKIDTRSEDNTGTSPSTQKQHNLAKLLTGQLEAMGAEEITYDREHCYVYASIPASRGCENVPVLGLVAHMDTAPVVSGRDVKPRIVENYDGNDIVLNEKENIILKAADYPELAGYRGQDLIVTDGTTLLGGDDKAGVAEIMAACEYLLQHPEVKHGKLRIGFTPDEEIGEGTKHFDIKLFGADFAYTVDGDRFGHIEDGTFNAAGAKLTVHGVSAHPGSAKDAMVNAMLIAFEFQSLLPVFQNPMYTEGEEGFFHLEHIEGDVEKTVSEYIIRDHDRTLFEQKKQFFGQCADFLNRKYGEGTAETEIQDSYYNMKEVLEPHRHLIENAAEIIRQMGTEPEICSVRGGTDGARLSYMGLPCPNLCTGGGNFHSRFEYVCVQSMEKVTELLVRLAEKYGEGFPHNS
ncbi:MAG: peptidase T [Lachnospiraceae bacterium]|jgi:tripeptide aminopeptidase|nr:peptidase T [Lachnospiraceae bacterium]